MLTTAGDGTVAGAWYMPVASMVPCATSPPVTPFTCQTTAVFEVFVTVAENFWTVATVIVASLGVTTTATPWGVLLPENDDSTLAHPPLRKARNRNDAAADMDTDRIGRRKAMETGSPMDKVANSSDEDSKQTNDYCWEAASDVHKGTVLGYLGRPRK
jgi:hypothetical protein